MANSWQRAVSLRLDEEALLGLVMAAAGHRALPARPWPFIAASQRLAKDLPKHSPLRTTAAISLVPGAEKVAERWLRVLAVEGFVSGTGRGVPAQWVMDTAWATGWSVVAEGAALLRAFRIEACRSGPHDLSIDLGKHCFSGRQGICSVDGGASADLTPPCPVSPLAMGTPSPAAQPPYPEPEIDALVRATPFSRVFS
jgi:hypothetical protein